MRTNRLLLTALAVVSLLASPVAPLMAADVPAPAGGNSPVATVSTRPDGLAEARGIVAQALRDHGLTEQQVEQRLTQLSDSDVLYLAGHAQQIQEGGSPPPNYIWTLLGVFLVVAIVAALL